MFFMSLCKAKMLAFDKNHTKSENIFDLVHTDIHIGIHSHTIYLRSQIFFS
ncbi:uncharacterized protein DS421_5g170060 [Arachis hypogaea]|nr:uncharacterized protein DS421_5g170060 [Arachis hypogaea]